MSRNEIAPLYILDILKKYTDVDHPIQFQEVEDILRDEYGIDYDRRTVSSKIRAMIDEGLLERAGRKTGAYFANREFDDSELMLLIYSVISNKSISPAQANNLVSRISKLGGDYFDISDIRIIRKADAVSEGGNQELFLNLESVHDAIRNSRQMEFTYCKFGVDGELHPSGRYTVSPYYVGMKNQKLYLMAKNEDENKVYFFRVEHIKDIEILTKRITDIKKVKGLEDGVDFDHLVSALPYMFSDKPQNITFRAEASIINHLIDWFGKEIIVGKDPKNEDKLLANIKTSPMAMKYWALQYLDSVEILAPPELREELHRSLSENTDKYASKTKVPKVAVLESSEEAIETIDDLAPGKLTEINHEYEDPHIKELDYYFNVKADKLIPKMFKNTGADGILDAPVEPSMRPVGSLGKHYFRCKMEWNKDDMENITGEFIDTCRGLSELASYHAELAEINPETRGDFSPEARKVWISYFKGLENEELEREMEKCVEHLIARELHPELFLNSEENCRSSGRVAITSERNMERIYWSDNREFREKVNNISGRRFAYERFVRLRRLYLLYAYNAPDTLIEMEARRLARFMALGKYCSIYNDNYWTK